MTSIGLFDHASTDKVSWCTMIVHCPEATVRLISKKRTDLIGTAIEFPTDGPSPHSIYQLTKGAQALTSHERSTSKPPCLPTSGRQLSHAR